jgi:predicted aspartyl protease
MKESKLDDNYGVIDFDIEVFNTWFLPVIEVDLYGQPYNFLVDTGANNTIISKETAEELYDRIHIDNTNDGFITTSGIGSEIMQSEIAKITVTIGNCNDCLECIVLDLGHSKSLKIDNREVKISGVLGSIFFSNYNWIIDYRSYKVYYEL